jgi:hypothetical protein
MPLRKGVNIADLVASDKLPAQFGSNPVQRMIAISSLTKMELPTMLSSHRNEGVESK